MFFRKSFFGRSLTQQHEKKSASRRRSWFGRRRGLAMEPLEERALLAIDITVSAILGSGSLTYPGVSGTEDGRVFRDGIPSVCGVADAYPGTAGAGTDFTFDSYSFTNPFSDTSSCVTVTYSGTPTLVGGGIFSVAYQGFNPADISQNYRGDAGESITAALPGPKSYGVDLAAQQSLDLVFSDVEPANANVGQPYTFTVSFDTTDVVINGTAGADTLVVTPTGPDSGTFQLNGGQVYSFSGITSLKFNGLDGNDTMTIDSTASLLGVPVEYQGGLGFDALFLTGGTATSDQYSVGPDPGQGTSTLVNGAVTQVVRFADLEPVFDNVAGPLVVDATNADNAINYTTGKDSVANFNANITNPTWGEVSVDNFEPIEFTNKTTLTINGLAGSDTINLNNPNTPAGPLTSITVNGGDPTGSDTVIVTGTAGADVVTIDQLTIDGARVMGLGPTINITTAEHLIYSGQGGNDDLTISTPAGGDQVEFTPAAQVDAGSLVMRRSGGGGGGLLGVAYRGLGLSGDLILANTGGGRSDEVVVNGLANANASEEFEIAANVAPGPDQVRVFDNTGGSFQFLSVLITASGAAELRVNGLAGDDVFHVGSDHAFTSGLILDGGEPDASDTLIFEGNGGDVNVNLAATFGSPPTVPSITEAALNPVFLLGVERADVNAGAGAITVNGRTTAETLDVTPTGANTATIVPSGLNLTINTDNTAALTLDPLGGADAVNYHGRVVADTITVTYGATTTVANTGVKTVGATSANTELLNVLPGEGGDNVTLTGDASVLVTIVDGGIGNDTINASAVTVAGVTLLGGAGDDTLTGGAGADRLEGGAGIDNLNGGDGSDDLFGGDDSDVLNPGSAGTDDVDGGGGDDLLVYDSGVGAYTVFGSFALSEVGISGPGSLVRAHDVQTIHLASSGNAGPNTYLIQDLSGTGVSRVNLNTSGDFGLAVISGLAGTLTLQGTGGNDTIDVTTDPAFGPGSPVRKAYLGWGEVVFSTASAGDALVVNGLEGNDTIKVDAALDGTIDITLNGGSGDDFLSADAILNGGDDNDTLIGGAGADTIDGGAGDDIIDGRGGANALDGGLGADTILVSGTAADDTITTVHTGGTFTITGGLSAGTNSITGLELVRIEAGDGSDTINVTTNGGGGLDYNIFGGTPLGAVGDTLNLILASDITFVQGPQSDSGAFTEADTSNIISFDEIEALSVTLTPADVVNIVATNADNDITIVGVDADSVMVSIDGGPAIQYDGVTALNVDALAGDDDISVTPGTFAGAGGINITGGAPTASDTVIVTGTAGLDAVTIGALTADGATITGLGAPIVVTTAEHLVYDGQGGGDSLTYSNAGAEATLTAGANLDAGSITADLLGLGALLPVAYEGLGAALGSVTMAVTALDVVGTANDDVFNVSTVGTIQIVKPTPGPAVTVPINTVGVLFLRLQGRDGDDTFNIPGDHPFAAGIRVDAGNPSASDVLNFTGSGAGAVTVDFGAATVQEVGFAPLDFTGVEILNVDADNALTIVGTASDDSMTVTVGSATSGQVINSVSLIQIGGPVQTPIAPVVNYTNITGALSVNLAGGEDRLAVAGNALSQTINVNASAAAFAFPGGYPATPANTVEVDDGNNLSIDGSVTFSNIEGLQVAGLEGNDTIQVRPGLTVPVFVDGGDPIGDGATQADTIVLQPVGFFLIEAGPEKDEGGMFNPPNQRVSWDHIELVVAVGSGPALILGTNGDDDITIIARDASTHPILAGFTPGVQDFTVSVNDGPDVLFIDQPNVLVDALAGDDDIVVREPAPNNAVWDVNVFIAGGTPASPTGDQGDVVEVETPGTQTVTYTPNPAAIAPVVVGPATITPIAGGADTAILDDTTNSSPITIAPFTLTIAAIPFTYTSSPGGVDQVVYDGITAFGADDFTINGSFNDTTNFDVASLSGTYRSLLSPDLDFSLVGALTVNAGVGNFDVVNITASAGDDVVTSTATAITVNTPGAIGIVTLGAGIDQVKISTLDGVDNIDLDLNVAGLRKVVDAGAGNDTVNMSGTIDADIFGGLGDDILIGSPAADNIFGGPGNDILVGGAGDDFQYGEEGNDIFGNLTLTPNGVADDTGVDNNNGGPGFDNFIWEPGDGADFNNGGDDGADIFRFFGNAAANVFILTTGGTPTHFNAFIGAVLIDNHGIEDVIVDGQGGADTFTVNDLFTTEVVNINLNLGAADAGAVDPVTVNARNVADNLLLSNPAAGGISIQGLRYNVNLTNAEPTDPLFVNGNNGDDLITAAVGTSTTVALTLSGGAGNDTLDASATIGTGVALEGDAGDDTLLGGAGNDSLRGEAVAPFGDDTFIGNGGTDAVGAGGGLIGDRIVVPGTPGNDVISLTLNGVGHLLVTINGTTTTYTNFAAGPIATSGVDLIVVAGGEGTDTLTVDSTSGAIPIAIEYDGGSGSDSLTLTGNVAVSDVYSVGPNPGQGTSTIVIGAVTQLVTFQNIEPVVDLVAGPLVVNATPADNAINFAANIITIDNFESIAIGNKTDVTINAGSGSDTININVPAGLTGVVNVNGGNPTASDTLIVNAIAGSLTDNFRILPTAQGAGTVDPDLGTAPSVNYTGIEVIEAVLQYAEDDTFALDGTAGDDLVQVVSGPVPGSSVITGLMNSAAPFTLPTIRVQNNNPVSGTTGIFNFFGAGGSDDFEVYGTASNDTFDISGLTEIVHSANGQVLNRYLIQGAAEVTIDGGDGDDTFNVAGITGGDILHVNGGNPSASDVLNYAAVGEVTLDLANQTIDDAGLVGSPDVTYTGVEIINLDLNTNDLNVEASDGDDDLTVTVLSATAGRIEQGVAIQRAGETAGNIVPPLVNYSDTATDADRVVFDMLLGEDTLFVVGNALAQTWLVDVPAGTVSIDDAPVVGNDGFLAWLNNESVQVFGLEGNDAFTVTAGLIPVFVDGGDPIGVNLPGDSINVVNAIGFFPGPEPDEGGFLTAGGTVSFDHIESLAVVPIPGCPFLIIGTNADDDITVIARDSVSTPQFVGADGYQDFTVSVNAGPDLLFIDQPDLYIDALSGDDDIVIRTPAPIGGLNWDVNVRVAGGPPSIGETNDGDRLVLETPGTDFIVYNPTGPDTGNIIIDVNNNGIYDAGPPEEDSIITFGPFTFVCPPVTYNSSPGGVELIEYDGEDSERNPAGGVVDNPDDVITINGTVGDDTTTVAPDDLGNGTFVSDFSPLFVFRSFQDLTVNPGAGGADFDHVIFNATEGPDVITTDADTLTLVGVLIHTVTLGAGINRLDVNTFGGNDNVDLDLQLLGLAKVVDVGAGNDIVNLSGVIVDPADPTIFGGIGDDNIVGSPNPDIIFAGAGNDIIIGGGGDDQSHGEDGNDIFGNPSLVPNGVADDPGSDFNHGGEGFDNFIWEPGDGPDFNNGGNDAADIFRFFGNAAANVFLLTTGGTPTHFNAFIGAVLIDNHGIEDVIVDGQGGADTFTVNDLYTTEVVTINLNLGAADAAAVDAVTVNGRNEIDTMLLSNPSAGRVTIQGLRYDVNLTNSEATDTLLVNGNNGNDSITAAAGVSTTVTLTLSGGAGNDSLIARDTTVTGVTLLGNEGDDFLEGGAGADTITGGAGEDTMVGNAGLDTFDGGTEFDTVLFRGTSGNDIISANQSAAGTLDTTLNGVLDSDTLVLLAGVRTVERVKIEAGAGDDVILVQHLDALGVDALVNSVLFDVDGGEAETRDRLSVQDNGTGDLLLYRKAAVDTAGSISVGPGNAESLENVFRNVEFIQPIAAAGGQVLVFKHDPNEFNDERINATHLGAGSTINLDPTIDPGPLTAGIPGGFQPLPGDQDWYRVEAEFTGTLDFQVFFTEFATVPSGRPGLPGNGNLDIQVLDADGTLIAGAGPLFGGNDNGGTNPELDVAPLANERIRIPVVQGQIYYVRVFGGPTALGPAAVAINNYTMSIINVPALVPYDIELDDNLGFGDAIAGGTAVNFSGTPRPGPQFSGLNPINGYYVGREITFTTGALDGETAVITAYTFAGGVGTFTVTPAFSAPPGAGDDFQIDAVDTGRSQFDDVTQDNTPTIFFRLDDAFFLQDLPGNPVIDTPPDEVIPIPFRSGPFLALPGYAIAIFDEGPGTVGATPPQTPLGFAFNVGDLNSDGDTADLGEAFVPGVYKFTTPLLTDGSHFLSARVQMIDPAVPTQTGFGARSLSLEIVVDTVEPPVSFGDPVDVQDGLLPDSDTGFTPFNTDLLIDLVTSDLTPTFWGRAEADAIIRLYVDINGNQVFDQNVDLFIGQATAIPLDGTNQEPHGYWEVNTVINFNDPTFFPVPDGLRTVFVVAEDLAGNINLPDAQDVLLTRLQIFIDTQGPQVTSVFITDVPAYDLFNPKGPDANAQGPTPLTKQITVTFQDLPLRLDIPDVDPLPPDDFLYPALKPETVITDHFQVIGDQNGRVNIESLGLTQTLVPVPGMPGFFLATATVVITFTTPLPDDRFTLIITDEVRDPVGNRLDGETNAAEPQEDPRFPSGDGFSGGDFVARFTIDTRPELAAYAGLRVYADINGNFVFDPEGQDNDHVNRDIVFRFGSTSDALFAGKFVTPPNVNAAAGIQVPAPVVANRFFDQIAAYGNILGAFRWLFDFDSNGVADLVTTQPAGFQINGIPVAGNFDGNFANGDEVGLFDGVRWWRDTNHDFVINGLDAAPIVGLSAGFPQVGDVDGDALDDFITYQGDTYFVDFANNGLGVGPVTSIPLTLDGGGLGFPGVSERPTVADMNQDGIDDFGVWVPGNLGQTPTEISEWYFLVSEYTLDPLDPLVTHVPGQVVPGAVPGALWSFQVFPLVSGSPRRHFEPVPFGTSLFAIFGDEPAFPIVGNFDPPVEAGSGSGGTSGSLDTNNVIVVAAGVGAEPRVHVYNRQTGELVLDILAYNPAFRGGVQVATADVNGDGVVDIVTAPGAGGGPHIRVFDGTSGAVITEFMAYSPAFSGGVFVATGDVNGDGRADIVTAPGAGGGPHVRIFSGATGGVLGEYMAYSPAFGGGVHVATGDINGDGRDDVITGPGAGGGPHIRVFNGVTSSVLQQYMAYNPAFGGGVWVAGGDINGDGRDDVITGAGAGGGPHVRVFSGANAAELKGFFAYDAAFTGGVRVGAGDLDGDGRADILTGPGTGGGPHVRAFDGDNLVQVASFLAFDGNFGGGVFVAAPNAGGHALRAASQGAGAAALSQSQLDVIVAAAIGQWDTASAGAARKLRGISVQVADLSGTLLGLAYDDVVLIDSDAAGHGWFVDSTPDTSDDLDASSIDLLSAVAHELGHVLGLDHDDAGLMDDELSAGVRPALEAVDAVFAEL